MRIELTQKQAEFKKEFKQFVDKEISPFADEFDREERMPREIITLLAKRGYLGMLIPVDRGGLGMDLVTYGLFCEEIGRGSSSLLSLIAVHTMVSQAILRWGSPSQQEYWLPKMATGEKIGAFALTEPGVGSDAKNVETTYEPSKGGFILNGEKKWLSFGQYADLFLVFTRGDGKSSVFIVEPRNAGVTVAAINGMYGFRSAMLAQLTLSKCLVPEENIVGTEGFGFSHVGGVALDYGRYTIGWGSVGLAQACLDASLRYASVRKQNGVEIQQYQLIKRMIADMVANIKAARLLCLNAGYLKDTGDPSSIMETNVAKYFSSTMVTRIAGDTMQLHGANGCGREYPVQRYLRDAKIMEIIEGSSQIQQLIISDYAYQEYEETK